MEFSNALLQYIQKYYSPTANRIVHILIIISITVSVLLYSLNYVGIDNIQNISDMVVGIAIIELVVGGIAILVVLLGRKNLEVEKIQKAIILNLKLMDGSDSQLQVQIIKEIDAVLSPEKKIIDKKIRKMNLKKCIQTIDPENKSNQ